MAKTAPTNWKSAAPGAWVTSNFTAEDIYSPVSQKLNFFSIVER